jgi:hypothetical protein
MWKVFAPSGSGSFAGYLLSLFCRKSFRSGDAALSSANNIVGLVLDHFSLMLANPDARMCLLSENASIE